MRAATAMAIMGLLATLFSTGCGAKKAFDEATALADAGDSFAAIEAYEQVVETYGGGTWEERSRTEIDRLVEGLVRDLVEIGAPGFDLPDPCTIVSAHGEAAEAGVTVDFELTCDGRTANTSGRILPDGKVWDLTPVEGVLTAEGECVFRSVANPFGDWAIPMPQDECHAERTRRQKVLDRYKQPGGLAEFHCDCRVGEARFEVPRGKPMWQTGPPVPEMPPGALKPMPLPTE